MNQSSDRVPPFKLSPKVILIGVVVLIGYLLLKPWIETQFNVALPGFTDRDTVTETSPADDSRSSTDGDFDPVADAGIDPDVFMGLSNNSDIKPTTIAANTGAQEASQTSFNGNTESPSSDASTTKTSPKSTNKNPDSTGPSTKPKTGSGTNPNSGTSSNTDTKPKKNDPPKPKIAPRPTPPKTNPKSNTPNTNSKPSEESAPPRLGALRKLNNTTYESTAGIKYTSGSVDGHRLTHLMKHAEDDLKRPVHGVFSVERKQILVLLDEAYQLGQKGKSKRVRIEKERNRTVYTVDMRKKIGYVGGQRGQRDKKPVCYKIRMVLEGNELITAYPVR